MKPLKVELKFNDKAVATIETKSYEKLVQDLENTPSLKIMKRPLRYFGMTLLLFSGSRNYHRRNS
ncbi:hypothetical protein KY290_021956 [Solanum tuberosum]|uniref:Uncharacterized protein n=1 Tax=Solanum tuberosum TaxID=4113 RepID=A0ABQ7V304_SOLTU|nr:hypothetical protein KY289_021123 [Solanum tuberosum]KAH0758463.1 hypothetical protein KY290_021956 [Solanum tuberosum]